MTGESFEGVSLTDQWQRVHSLARAWRTYTDGRPGKQSAPPADGKKPIPHWKRKKQLPLRSADEDEQYCYDDY